MTAQRRNIYPIRPARGAACLALCAAVLALFPSAALATCESIAGAGDEYCESIPGAGGDRDAAPPKLSRGVPAATSRALERAGAGAVRQVETPGSERRVDSAEARAPGPDPGGEGEEGEEGGASLLPWVLAALTVVLVLTAIARRLGLGSPASPAS